MFWKRKKKSKFTCSECGKVHSNWPALTFSSPANYNNLTDQEKIELGEIDSDFCTISYEEQTDRFIRVSLIQEVVNSQEDLQYGLWVSLREKSYQNYKDNFNNENHKVEYFGWLSSSIPRYEFNNSIPTTVVTQAGNQRPLIFPHKDFDHPFVKDFYNGISAHEAQERVDDIVWK